MAGSIGGNNAQAANIVTAIYIATGQVRIVAKSISAKKYRNHTSLHGNVQQLNTYLHFRMQHKTCVVVCARPIWRLGETGIYT